MAQIAGTAETETRRQDEQECRELVVAITQYGDHGEFIKAAALYAEEGQRVRGHTTYSGHAEIEASYRETAGSALIRHMIGGTTVTVGNDDRAYAITYYLAFRHEANGVPASGPAPLDAPFSMGEWHDELIRTPDGWRFARRETKRLFERSG